MKDKLDTFREEMVKRAKELGIDLKIGTITYGANTMSFSAKGYDLENKSDALREEFYRYAGKKGVPLTWFGKSFRNDGDVFRIYGIAPRGRKNVVKATKVSDNTEWVFPKGLITDFVN